MGKDRASATFANATRDGPRNLPRSKETSTRATTRTAASALSRPGSTTMNVKNQREFLASPKNAVAPASRTRCPSKRANNAVDIDHSIQMDHDSAVPVINYARHVTLRRSTT